MHAAQRQACGIASVARTESRLEHWWLGGSPALPLWRRRSGALHSSWLGGSLALHPVASVARTESMAGVTLSLCLAGARLLVHCAAVRSQNRVRPKLRALGEILESVTIAVVIVFLVVYPFVAQPYLIPSGSMVPTFRERDRILVDKLAYRFHSPARGEIVVFRAPDDAIPQGRGGDQEFVKRVIGLPGDTVEISGGLLYVNDQIQREPYALDPPDYDLPPYVVPPKSLFVMGDNRNHSNDSHRWGALPSAQLVGRAALVFWPPRRCCRID